METRVCDTCQQLFAELTCPACEASEIDELESRLEKQAEVIAVMREALEFYAERDNYDREGVLYADSEYTVDYGYKAGQALAKAEEMLK